MFTESDIYFVRTQFIDQLGEINLLMARSKQKTNKRKQNGITERPSWGEFNLTCFLIPDME